MNQNKMCKSFQIDKSTFILVIVTYHFTLKRKKKEKENVNFLPKRIGYICIKCIYI